jgi:hypothetical protein
MNLTQHIEQDPVTAGQRILSERPEYIRESNAAWAGAAAYGAAHCTPPDPCKEQARKQP